MLTLAWGLSLAPAQLLAAPQPWRGLFMAALVARWLAVLALLLARTRDPLPA